MLLRVLHTLDRIIPPVWIEGQANSIKKKFNIVMLGPADCNPAGALRALCLVRFCALCEYSSMIPHLSSAWRGCSVIPRSLLYADLSQG